jgi:drug/metabolite transporter (DMT)-like permease
MNSRDWLRLVALSVLWGGTFLFVSLSLRSIPEFTVVFLRVSLAAAAFWLLMLATGRTMPRDWQTWRGFLMMGLINNAIPFSLITWEQTQVEGGVASIMNAITSFFAVVLAHFLTKDEKLSTRKVAGVLIGLLGAYILLRPELYAGVSMRGLGQIAGLTASMFLALAGIFGKRFRSLSPMQTATGMLTCSSVVMFPVAMVIDRPWNLALDLAAVGAIAGLVLLSTVLAYLLYFAILRSAGATNLLLVTLLMPVSAHILGAVILGEPLYATSVAGMAFIILGLSIIDGRLLRRLRGTRATAPASSAVNRLEED